MMRTRPSRAATPRALACLGHDPRLRLRHAANLGITERSAYGIVTGLAWAG